jgi:hypothetical protein
MKNSLLKPLSWEITRSAQKLYHVVLSANFRDFIVLQLKSPWLDVFYPFFFAFLIFVPNAESRPSDLSKPCEV